MSLAGDAIFLMGDSGLVEMRAQLFDSEEDLQELVARHPELLAGAQMTPGDPRRWMLVRREMGVPRTDGGGDHFSVDHLFVDQDGVPTIVEVKRSTDTRIRREVVGQMLDYAANAVRYWPVENLKATHEAACRRVGRDPLEELRQLVGHDVDPEEFWARVGEHLAIGRLRMVFVADVVPPELQRIVEFLNEGMSRAQVYAVELPQYVGAGQRSLVPRLIGATAAARQSARRDRSSPGVDALVAAATDDVRFVDEALQRWAQERDIVVRDTSSGRGYSKDGVSLAMFYPGWSSLEIYLGPLRTGGHADDADSLQRELAALCRSKRITATHPNLPTVDLASNWPEASKVLDRYVDVMVRAKHSLSSGEDDRCVQHWTRVRQGRSDRA